MRMEVELALPQTRHGPGAFSGRNGMVSGRTEGVA
jgi:hypothetical protein